MTSGEQGEARSNQAIYNALSEIVIGHDYAKKVLINLVNRSKLRYYQKWLMLEEKLIKLSNCLLIGDSGTGKTFLVETLASIMDFPFVRIDATELNPTGATGGVKKKDLVKKITDKVKELREQEMDQYGQMYKYFSFDGTLDQVIVFVDEVDKLGLKLSSDWNKDVQSNFLTIFENNEELAGVSFIFAGAFSGMLEVDGQSNHMGFNKQEHKEAKERNLTADVIKWGLIPELVGRFNHIVALDKLTSENYLDILETKILIDAREQLKFFNTHKFELTDEQKSSLVDTAMKSGLGVRALETGVQKLLVELEFNSDSTTLEML